MADDYLKAVIKSNVMEHVSGDNDRVRSTASVYSSNSSYDGEYDTEESPSKNTMGLRSPGGPLRGRSVKEIEEQLSNLKKENFNLKLRIYFLEEKMGTNFTLDKDNVVKKYIELQVQYSNLQKEVDEKHELLCQAVKAMELEDEEHKKYVANKEEQLNMCQQELEDLRIQLQDSKFDSDGLSLKSDTTGFYSSRATNSGSLVAELQEKIKILETELQLEKENNASLQFFVGQTETLKTRYDNMQAESAMKDETIKSLREEIDVANKRILESSCQIKDVQDDLEKWQRKNQMLHKDVINENKRFCETLDQLRDMKKKFMGCKEDLEREHKRNERLKAISDAKTSELEKEIEKQKAKIRDLQGKLETALVEIRKNQNLAVSKSPAQTSTTPNTDFDHVSVSDATAPAGAAEADALHVPVTPERSSAPQSPSSAPPSPSSPDAFGVAFEEAMIDAGDIPGAFKIISEFHKLRSKYDTQRQRLVKVKTEQFKACEIIKSMIDSRNKANNEIAELRMHVTQLEKELESVVTQPSNVMPKMPREEPRKVALEQVRHSLYRDLRGTNMKPGDIYREVLRLCPAPNYDRENYFE